MFGFAEFRLINYFCRRNVVFVQRSWVPEVPCRGFAEIRGCLVSASAASFVCGRDLRLEVEQLYQHSLIAAQSPTQGDCL